jgi:N-methylhydantoinase A
MLRIGIEVGGTFTDLLSIENGNIRVIKVPSVYARPDEGAYSALQSARISVANIEELVHGSTVVTNTIIQRSGAKVAFVTTHGFRDILMLQRHNRERVFDIFYSKPEPLVERKDCFEVKERTLADGSAVIPLSESLVERELVPALANGRYEAVAVCLLNAYINPAHERRVGKIISQSLPDLPVTLSSDIACEFREYERASTTVIAAHVQPVVARYLERFENYLAKHAFRGRFSLMQSNGGRLPVSGVRRNPVSALFSGPAAGVIGAIRQAGLSEYRNLITFDMGGTSTDVCLVKNGEPDRASQTMIDGLPVRTPLFDIVSVGAGCGSIVWADAEGMLRVGPASAGSYPGPVCYGRGGERPTITDAHVVRGTLRSQAFLGGAMAIDPMASQRALAKFGARFKLGPAALADSAIRIVEANTVRAIQLVSTRRGHDPRDFVLVAFGGAGPLHAARVAEELNIETVLIPPYAGVLSAFGLLTADYRVYETTTRHIELNEQALRLVRATYGDMRQRMLTNLRDMSLATDSAQFNLTLEMRFVGQAYEVAVDIDPDTLNDVTAEALAKRFHEAHQRMYFHGAMNQQRTEIVALRLGVTVPSEDVPSLAKASEPPTIAGDVFQTHYITDDKGQTPCEFAPREALASGLSLNGPMILEDVTSTIFVPPGWKAAVDAASNIILRGKL